MTWNAYCTAAAFNRCADVCACAQPVATVTNTATPQTSQTPTPTAEDIVLDRATVDAHLRSGRCVSRFHNDVVRLATKILRCNGDDTCIATAQAIAALKITKKCRNSPIALLRLGLADIYEVGPALVAEAIAKLETWEASEARSSAASLSAAAADKAQTRALLKCNEKTRKALLVGGQACDASSLMAKLSTTSTFARAASADCMSAYDAAYLSTFLRPLENERRILAAMEQGASLPAAVFEMMIAVNDTARLAHGILHPKANPYVAFEAVEHGLNMMLLPLDFDDNEDAILVFRDAIIDGVLSCAPSGVVSWDCAWYVFENLFGTLLRLMEAAGANQIARARNGVSVEIDAIKLIRDQGWAIAPAYDDLVDHAAHALGFDWPTFCVWPYFFGCGDLPERASTILAVGEAHRLILIGGRANCGAANNPTTTPTPTNTTALPTVTPPPPFTSTSTRTPTSAPAFTATATRTFTQTRTPTSASAAPSNTPTGTPTIAPSISPQVNVTCQTLCVGGSGLAGKQGALFNQPGSGFTRNGSVTLHFSKPNGLEYPTTSVTADSNGNYAHSYTSSLANPPGLYQYWAIDNTTGLSSNIAVFQIDINPTVSVSPSSGARGTTFSQPGAGFTPNWNVTLHFRKPDGTEYPTLTVATDANGNYAHSYSSSAGNPVGTYQYWAIDNGTATQSNTTSFSIY